jgi:hypothetical protein
MKIDNSKLLIFIEAINKDLLRLIMQLMAFSEAIADRFPTEAQHRLEVL